MSRRLPGLVLLALVLGCASSPSTGHRAVLLRSPTRLTLFSIDGRDEDRRQRDGVTATDETFHGYPVLGKVEITDPRRREKLVAALHDGIARAPEGWLECFEPRHGIRAVEEGKMLEYVICFECSEFREFVDGKRLGRAQISADVRPIFDWPLNEANIPIAPR